MAAEIRAGKAPPGHFLTTLKVDHFYEDTDLEKHLALRSAASRYGKLLKRKFKVHKTENEKGVPVIRVYRIK